MMPKKKYIELDAALAALGEEPYEWVDYSEAQTQEHNDWECHYNAISAIPAADVVEVRHGKKIDITTVEDWVPWCKCSVCGYDGLFMEDNFCSHCGAKLDGGQDE